jgi:hypothetical protein
MNESLEIVIAREEIERYNDAAIDPVIHDHEQAQECQDCEDFLRSGVGEFGSLIRAEETLHKAHRLGLLEWNAALEEVLRTLYIMWLQPCERADKWVEKQKARGYDVDGLKAYLECCDAAREWVSRDQMHAKGKAARDQRFAEEPW